MSATLQQQLSWEQSRTLWAAALNPILANAILGGNQLTGISIGTSATSIPHGLNQMQQGWFLTDNTTNCTVWRSGPFNSTALTLTASSQTSVNIWCF